MYTGCRGPPWALEILHPIMEATHPAACVYFIVLQLFLSFLVFSLFVPLILKGLDAVLKADETRRKAEKQQRKLEEDHKRELKEKNEKFETELKVIKDELKEKNEKFERELKAVMDELKGLKQGLLPGKGPLSKQ